ncbi:MAG: NAD/NADP octopine/nopaline dehydrogenase family protein, partial [Eubacterium sp.]|nr:NAD/NADP octopine/nopaline dehydrogenase family protein [Eubacterium sp.]
MKTVAVLGGGGTGCMMAADNALRGNSVRLWEDQAFFNENLSEIKESGGIEVVGNAISGFAKIPMLTSDMAQAVQDADVVLIAAMAERHKSICQKLAPLLRSGQTVCFSAGNSSSITLKKMLHYGQDVVVGEMSGNCYPCRIVGKAKVSSAFPYKPKPAAAFPAQDNARFVSGLDGVYQCIAIQNVLEATLNSPNLVIHIAGSLLNAGAIDKDPEFKLYKQGITKNTVNVMEKVEDEKIRVMKTMGYNPVLHVPMLHRVMDYDNHPELALFRMVSGPSGMSHR